MPSLLEMFDKSLNEPLPMDGRLSLLPARITKEGKEFALPGLLASAWNAFTAPARSYKGEMDDPMGEALNVAGMAMTGAMPFSAPKGSLGMNVWHGSPHKFNKFDSSKIGTGEGAQAYGHGLYTAEAKAVGEEYRKMLAADRFLVGDNVFDPSTLKHLNVRSIARKGNLDDAIQKAKSIASGNGSSASLAADDLQVLNGIKAAGGMKPNPGNLYKIDLPDEQIAKMLDWDKPLSQQAKDIKHLLPDVDSAGKVAAEKIRALARQDGLADWARQDLLSDAAQVESSKSLQHISGVLKRMQMDYGISPDRGPFAKVAPDFLSFVKGMQAVPNMDTGGGAVAYLQAVHGDKAAAELLRQAGIPGIRYLDGGSRGVGKGSSNFVVFPGNENLLTILERNGAPIQK